jgi:hypothetical protein
VLHKLQELRLWQGSLWAALSETPSKYATEQPGCVELLYVFFPSFTDFGANPSHRHITPTVRAHRRLGEAFVSRTPVALLHHAVRDCICPAKGTKRVGRGGAPRRIWQGANWNGSGSSWWPPRTYGRTGIRFRPLGVTRCSGTGAGMSQGSRARAWRATMTTSGYSESARLIYFWYLCSLTCTNLD